jgi:hypothetical protein
MSETTNNICMSRNSFVTSFLVEEGAGMQEVVLLAALAKGIPCLGQGKKCLDRQKHVKAFVQVQDALQVEHPLSSVW